jgi:CHAT domain-containing protein
VPTILGLKDKIETYRSLLSNSYKAGNSNEYLLKGSTSSVTNTDPKTLAEISEYLGRFLVEPILSQISSKKKIIISPDGPLAFIPFETLSVDGSLLVENYDVSYVQSFSMLSLLKDRKAEYKKLTSRKEIFAVGGATYSQEIGLQRSKNSPSDQSLNKASKVLLASRGSEGVQEAFDLLDAKWIDLPGTEKEVRSVVDMFTDKDSLILVKSEASEQNLQRLNKSRELKKYKRMLFSTHGYLSPNEPALSSIVLSQNNKSSKADGYLTASEIPAYDLKSDLVVLSACETGLGKIVSW